MNLVRTLKKSPPLVARDFESRASARARFVQWATKRLLYGRLPAGKSSFDCGFASAQEEGRAASG
jgi:hypothetical protein